MRLTNTLSGYQRRWLMPDMTAGLIVAALITPQAMAYALLAGMPAQAGLYAALLPVLAYALLGSSPILAVGPVAVISLMTFEALHNMAMPGSTEYLSMASALALLTGLWLLLFFLIDLGRWTTFISHSVISAFTSATAILIVVSQLKYITGIPVPGGNSLWQTAILFISNSEQWQPDALSVALAALLLLSVWQWLLPKMTARLPQSLSSLLNKSGPLAAVVAGIIIVQTTAPDIATIGELPAGLPALTLPILSLEQWQTLLPAAAVIALLGYLSSLSAAAALAPAPDTGSVTAAPQRLHSNQELLALGTANLAAAFSQAFPVAGGFGRSVVNRAAGARTQLASIITVVLVALVCLFASRLFMDLPYAVLAVIIVSAVIPLISFRDAIQAWRFQKSDGLVWLVTFTAVLAAGAVDGILLGMVMSLVLYLRRSSEPHIAEIGRVGNSDHFRNVKRHQVTTSEQVLMIRIDENLYFANGQYLEDVIRQRLQRGGHIRHVVLVGSAINHIDFSGFETLQHLLRELRKQHIQLHLAEVKGPVMDQLGKTNLLEELAPGQVFFTASEALRTLADR
ncbi:MAG: STAS domain-containing protein [Saccharospirillaceae bacterium]|nr:STAS domain-containing protein [Saccharospirillaceae bacterium]MCD8532589.1 STAS domain-containing protein [Saccharospirillaceae bacterium]